MREITVDIPLRGVTAQLLKELIGRALSVSFAKARANGIRMICRVPSGVAQSVAEQIAEEEHCRLPMTVLDSDGSVDVLQITASWKDLVASKDGDDGMLKMIRSAASKPIFITSGPRFRGDLLRISFLAEEKTIVEMKKDIERSRLSIKMVRLAPPRGGEVDPLSVLTARQARVLRLAHSMGYYEVPKKARVEDVARALDIEKGTAGEHLRRAEKHVFDSLLSG